MINKNKKDEMIKFLLEHANPSIKRRVKSEILNNLTPQEAAEYQEQILAEPIMRRIAEIQRENGWIGQGFNGGLDTQEGAVKYLAGKAINKDTPVLKNAMGAFVTIPFSDPTYYDPRGVLDEFKYPCSGFNLHRCACIARAGYDDEIDISPQIQLAVDSFRRVTEIDSVFDILHTMKKSGKIRYVFNDYEKWPSRHHLDILAHTGSWKNGVNIKTVADAINEMMRTDNPNLVSFVPSSQIGCTGGVFPAQGLTVMGSGVYPSPILCEIGKNGKDYNGKYHFELIEWFARCGVVPFVPALNEIVEEIASSIDDDGVCRLTNVPLDLFKAWGPFGGLQLEVDWKSKTRRDCDITFRALLILYYANIGI